MSEGDEFHACMAPAGVAREGAKSARGSKSKRGKRRMNYKIGQAGLIRV